MRKVRRCAFCGRRLKRLELRLCGDCVGDPLLLHGFGGSPDVNTEVLWALARRRSAAGRPPLEGMSIEEVNALARDCTGTPYATYGKLRAYVDSTGKLPPRRGE